MIIVFFGQPSSGKTTLAHELQPYFRYSEIVDGDAVRQITRNFNYTRQGRITNLKNVTEYACELTKEKTVIVSAIYPYEESRQYLNTLHDNVFWIYLKYDSNDRDKAKFRVHDFEPPIKSERLLELDTGFLNIESCRYNILYFIDNILHNSYMD